MSGRKNAKKATMTKTYLALALLITVLAGNAYGEDEVYYCAEIDKNGFAYDEKSGSYVSTRFTTEKFKIKLDRALNTIEMRPDYFSQTFRGEDGKVATLIPPKFTCAPLYVGIPELLSCAEISGSRNIQLNTKSGRFVLSSNSGYFQEASVDIGGGHLSLSVSYGTCDKF